MITSHAIRSSDRHRHLPLHRRRGLDEAPARARRRGVCRGAGRASPHRARGVRGRGRRRGRHAGRRLLLRVPDSTGSFAAAAGDHGGARTRPDPPAHRPAHGHPLVTDEGYVGDDVHFAARVAAQAMVGRSCSRRRPRSSSTASLTDLGEHRLKDIEGAVSIYQLGDEDFPPLKTISNTNLPRPASSFVGREQELEDGAREVRARGAASHPYRAGRLRQDPSRAGGRRELVPTYKAGVFWVGLAPLRDHRSSRRRSRRRSARRTASPSTSASGRCCSCSTTWSR